MVVSGNGVKFPFWVNYPFTSEKTDKLNTTGKKCNGLKQKGLTHKETLLMTLQIKQNRTMNISVQLTKQTN